MDLAIFIDGKERARWPPAMVSTLDGDCWALPLLRRRQEAAPGAEKLLPGAAAEDERRLGGDGGYRKP